MSLKEKVDVDYNEIVTEASKLISHIIEKYEIKSFEEFTCPYMRALAIELYNEI